MLLFFIIPNIHTKRDARGSQVAKGSSWRNSYNCFLSPDRILAILMNTRNLTAELKQEALRQGFDLVGVCRAGDAPGFDGFQSWLSAGYAGEMHYLTDRREAYRHPSNVLKDVRSLVMLGINYRTCEPSECTPGQGQVSRYAWGDVDYHDLIHGRLKKLKEFLLQREPAARVRGVVDTAPLLERDFAQLAGLGWIGKNTLLLNKQIGSWFFLAALLTDIELDAGFPHETDHCGTCRACLDICPTDAFPEPYVLDATKCVSYLTIELRDHIPGQLREGMGNWLFGCDDCQTVCPWNRHAPISEEPGFVARPGQNPIDLINLFELDNDQFRARFRHTPLWRSKRRGILRNAAIVLGNQRSVDAVAALIKGMNDDEHLVRAASAWALGRLDDQGAREALCQRLKVETDESVKYEIRNGLAS